MAMNVRGLVNRLVPSGGFDVARIEAYYEGGGDKLGYDLNEFGERVKEEYNHSISVSREGNGKLVAINYSPTGIRWRGGETAVAAVTQWAEPRGEIGPGNDYHQVGESEYFVDLASCVDRANELLISAEN